MPQDDKPDKSGRSQEWLSELSSFRRDAMKVSDDDLRNWRNEALRSRPQGEGRPAAELRRGPSKARLKRRQQLLMATLIVVTGFVASWPSLRASFEEWKSAQVPSAPPSAEVPLSAGSVAPRELPRTDHMRLRAEPEELIHALALATWEIEWALPRIEKHYPRPWDLETDAPLRSLIGPMAHYAPEAERSSVQLAARLLGLAPRSDLDHIAALEEALAASPGDSGGPDSLLLCGEDDALGAGSGSGAAAVDSALAQARLGKTDEALASLKGISEGHGENVWLGAILELTRGKADAAVALLEEGIAKHPGEAALSYRQAWVRRIAHQRAEGRQVLEALMKKDENAVGPRVLLALGALYTDKDHQAAARLLEPFEARLGVLEEPDRTLVASIMGESMARARSTERAKDLLVDARASQVDSTWAASGWARLAQLEKRPLDAAEAMSQLLRSVPGSPMRRELADLYAGQKRQALAFGRYRALMVDQPGDQTLKTAFDGLVEALDFPQVKGILHPDSPPKP